jgi:hypothetical protein
MRRLMEEQMMRSKVAAPRAGRIDSFATLLAELAEGVELLRPHYPEASDEELRARAAGLLGRRYAEGRWPDLGPLPDARAAGTDSDAQPL